MTDKGKFVLNLLPSGILHPEVVCVLGNGMVIDPDHLRHEIEMMRYMNVKISPENLKISEKATVCMPFHVRQDVLEEERLSKTGEAFGSTKRGIAYAYGDKYMKKTLRMGDLLYLDSEVIKKRIAMIVESKNLILEKVYGQKPLSVEEVMDWCKGQAEFLKPISSLRHSLAHCVILITEFILTHQALVRSQPMQRSVRVFQKENRSVS